MNEIPSPFQKEIRPKTPNTHRVSAEEVEAFKRMLHLQKLVVISERMDGGIQEHGIVVNGYSPIEVVEVLRHLLSVLSDEMKPGKRLNNLQNKGGRVDFERLEEDKDPDTNDPSQFPADGNDMEL
jgi:hypothetical protein